MTQPFRNRQQAGQLLAQRLLSYQQRQDVVVLALPRGGVPIGFEVAQVLQVPLDVCLVRKLGTPHNKELAMGAIALGNIRVLNQEIIDHFEISEADLEAVIAQEQAELEHRDRLYHASRQRLEAFTNQTLILIDDGIATGATVQAALAILKQQAPKRLIVATPVASPSALTLFPEAEEVIALITPEPLHSIGLWYTDFSQVPDAEVCRLLELSSQHSPHSLGEASPLAQPP
jgi:putative phosphoribosyl transferase